MKIGYPNELMIDHHIPEIHGDVTGNVNPGIINPKRLFNWEGTI